MADYINKYVNIIFIMLITSKISYPHTLLFYTKLKLNIMKRFLFL